MLCSGADGSALWVFERLRARERAAVSLLLTEALARADVRWEHRVDDRGASVALAAGDGSRVDGRCVGAVLNRLMVAPLPPLGAIDPGDRLYARSEATAFASSWLRVLGGRVANRPDPQGLCGRWRPPIEWRLLAARAGVPANPLRVGNRGEPEPRTSAGAGAATWTLAVGGRLLYDGVPAALQRAIGRLCAAAGTGMLGICFEGADPARAGWRLLDASPQPDLSIAGEAGVAAIERLLTA